MKKLLTAVMCLLSVSAFAQVSFTDDTGQQITMDKVPEKVVVLNSSNLELFLAAGGEPAAYAESSTMPDYIREKVKDLPNMGRVNNPDIESIAAMKPDLVIGMNFPFHIALRSSLESAGIKTAMFSIQQVEEIKNHMDIFGKITGKPEYAKKSWEKINSRIEQVKAETAALEKKKVLVLFGSPESFSMALSDSYVGQMVTLAGGKNIADGSTDKSRGGMFTGFVPVNLEFVMLHDPDIIFIITHEDNISPVADRSLMQHPAWQHLRAVKEEKAVKLPFATYGVNPTVRTGDAVYELSRLIYPEHLK